MFYCILGYFLADVMYCEILIKMSCPSLMSRILSYACCSFSTNSVTEKYEKILLRDDKRAGWA